MASLDEVREDYCDENLPVLLLLGLVSALRRLDALLPAPGPVSENPGPAGLPGSGGGRLLYLVLGLVAFRGRLLSTLAPTEARHAEPPSAPLPGLRELLR